MASQAQFARSKDAKEAGWYSRRHRTLEESQAMKAARPYTGRRAKKTKTETQS